MSPAYSSLFLPSSFPSLLPPSFLLPSCLTRYFLSPAARQWCPMSLSVSLGLTDSGWVLQWSDSAVQCHHGEEDSRDCCTCTLHQCPGCGPRLRTGMYHVLLNTQCTPDTISVLTCSWYICVHLPCQHLYRLYGPYVHLAVCTPVLVVCTPPYWLYV